MSRPLLEFGGSSGEILRDLLHLRSVALLHESNMARNDPDPVWCEKAAEARSVLVESPK